MFKTLHLAAHLQETQLGARLEMKVLETHCQISFRKNCVYLLILCLTHCVLHDSCFLVNKAPHDFVTNHIR